MNPLHEYIREQNGTHGSLEEQIELVEWFFERDITEDQKEWVKTPDIEDQTSFDHKLNTLLRNLEEIDVLDKKQPTGGKRGVVHERTDEFLVGEGDKTERLLQEDLSSLVDHAEENAAIRRVATATAGVDLWELELYVSEPDPLYERTQRLDEIVVAIEEDDNTTVGEGYGRIFWRMPANRWRLTGMAAARRTNQTLPLEGE